MIEIRFLSYFAKTIGQKKIVINKSSLSVKQILQQLAKDYPNLEDIFLEDIPSISLILNKKSLYVTKDLDKIAEGELIIGPIVAGGYFNQ